jgi:UDP-N-acetylglucosamine 2-epimerase (non-hydrolysing)
VIKVLVIFGTRPEAIKMAPVVAALRARAGIEVKVCVTGQHREMLDQVLRLFALTPDFDLDLMREDQTLTELTGGVLTGVRAVLHRWRPDLAIVHGDTTSSFAASLAAFYERVSVAHVESGLRSHDRHSPWPEEVNRRLTDVMSDLHFAPTECARRNLLSEGVPDDSIWVTGNTVVDALLQIVHRIETEPAIPRELDARFSFLARDKKIILVTGHRRENFGAGLEAICSALETLSQRRDVEIVYPVHLNPKVKGPVNARLGDRPGIHLLPPLEYLPFVYLMTRAALILTDSGGIQEEAPSLGKPVLLMREQTERPEALDVSAVKLVGTSSARIVAESARLLDDSLEYARMAAIRNPYGDGHASDRIAAVVAGER